MKSQIIFLLLEVTCQLFNICACMPLCLSVNARFRFSIIKETIRRVGPAHSSLVTQVNIWVSTLELFAIFKTFAAPKRKNDMELIYIYIYVCVCVCVCVCV